ncbi:MAG: histidine kinase dimerization/phospho-acceptor domain-containing protein, partial [Chloroflexota bacterium]
MNNTAEHERRSVLLRIITLAWLGFIVAAILSTIPIVIRQGLIWIDVVYGAHLVCGITVLYLNRRGFPRTAAMLFVYSFNLILLAGYAYSVYMRGGEVITSTAFIGVTYTLSLSILLGGILLGANSALQFAVFNNAALLMIFFVIAPDDAFASAGERSSYIGTLFSFQWLLALIAWLYERTLTGAFNRLTVAKSDLEQAVHNLEEAVAARTEELRMAKETAERANVAKSGFLSNVSHELRTPMNAIMGFAQLMERDTTLTSTQRENLSVISQSGEHLLELINDVLEMSRIEAGQIMLDENNFDLHHAIQRIDDMFRQRIENKNVEFQLNMAHDVPELVHADQRKLRQVLINLLS